VTDCRPRELNTKVDAPDRGFANGGNALRHLRAGSSFWNFTGFCLMQARRSDKIIVHVSIPIDVTRAACTAVQKNRISQKIDRAELENASLK
jgi:hypothetical protein